jgi:hypothetical protein
VSSSHLEFRTMDSVYEASDSERYALQVWASFAILPRRLVHLKVIRSAVHRLGLTRQLLLTAATHVFGFASL